MELGCAMPHMQMPWRNGWRLGFGNGRKSQYHLRSKPTRYLPNFHHT
jgi:hypothetical protein